MHDWHEIGNVPIYQCARCHYIRLLADEVPTWHYYYRGERNDPDPDIVDICLGDPLPPVPLTVIKEMIPEASRAKLVWALIHHNAPPTHVITILNGLHHLVNADGIFALAIEHHQMTGRKMLEIINKIIDKRYDQ
jgi:hypothetical protein